MHHISPLTGPTVWLGAVTCSALAIVGYGRLTGVDPFFLLMGYPVGIAKDVVCTIVVALAIGTLAALVARESAGPFIRYSLLRLMGLTALGISVVTGALALSPFLSTHSAFNDPGKLLRISSIYLCIVLPFLSAASALLFFEAATRTHLAPRGAVRPNRDWGG